MTPEERIEYLETVLHRIMVRAEEQPVHVCDVAKFDLATIGREARIALAASPAASSEGVDYKAAWEKLYAYFVGWDERNHLHPEVHEILACMNSLVAPAPPAAEREPHERRCTTAMSVQELIDELQKVTDKTKSVWLLRRDPIVETYEAWEAFVASERRGFFGISAGADAIYDRERAPAAEGE
jgi:hypothetical protein